MILRQKKKGAGDFPRRRGFLVNTFTKRCLGKERQPPAQRGPGMRGTSGLGCGCQSGPTVPRLGRGARWSPGSPRGYRSPETAALGAAPQDASRERPPRLASQSDRGSRHGSLNEKEPRARGRRRSHLHQAPVGSRAAARETACSPRSGDPVRVASPAGSNWLPPWRSGNPARESIKLLLKGPRFAPGTEGGKRRGSHPRGLCGAQSLLGNVVYMRKLARVASWEV